ncbi:HIT family protein [Rickettsiales bacterium]|nr:HIT family protein [Rickettsiales bacterium]MDB2550498.1 HIT family protein [Rickettsiales bacterium]
MSNNITNFTLDQRLENDCFLIKELKLSKLLLMNNKLYPWFILVPKRNNMKEITDLEFLDQQILLKEINDISKIIQNNYNPDKLNIAALGNVVPQLHIHIIARYKNDKTFPNPVWISSEKQEYNDKDIQDIISFFMN